MYSCETRFTTQLPLRIRKILSSNILELARNRNPSPCELLNRKSSGSREVAESFAASRTGSPDRSSARSTSRVATIPPYRGLRSLRLITKRPENPVDPRGRSLFLFLFAPLYAQGISNRRVSSVNGYCGTIRRMFLG